MPRRQVPQLGDIYWVDPNPVKGHEMKDKHPFVVITPEVVNQLGVAMTVPITTSGQFAKMMGLTVKITGEKITGVAVCNQVRTFDLESRVKDRTAQYVEKLDDNTVNDIVDRVISLLSPAE